MASATSAPPATSITWLRSALGLSRVTKMGGFGLFLDPGGRPRGRRLGAATTAPSRGSPPPDSLVSSAWSPGAPPAGLGSGSLTAGDSVLGPDEPDGCSGRPK